MLQISQIFISRKKQVWRFDPLALEPRDRFVFFSFSLWPMTDTYLVFFVCEDKIVNWKCENLAYLSKHCHQLDDWERCTSLKHLYLSSEGLHSGQKGYIVCGTAYCYGEDITPRGYIRIYAVIDVIPGLVTNSILFCWLITIKDRC